MSARTKPRKRTPRAGDPVEMRVRPDGHLEMEIFGEWRLSSHVIWLMMTGSWPDGEIEHVNGDKTDLRIFNLCLKPKQSQLAV